mgnify:CR=1 FL=1
MIYEERESYDHCGVLGLSFTDEDCVYSLAHGIFHLQHRGQEYCGLALEDEGEIHAEAFRGLVSDSFTPEVLSLFKGKHGIAHTSLKDPQPFVLESRIGKFAIAFSGNIINAREIKEELMRKGFSFSSNYHVEILAKLVAQANNIKEGLESLPKKINGSYSIVLLADDGSLYAMRDPLGVKPFIAGASAKGVCVASESAALNGLGMKIIKDIEPGGIYLLRPTGISKISQVESERIAHCAFEYAYTARIDSVINSIPVATARNNLGASLAKDDDIEATVVAGVPMSGLGHALGYHKASEVPYGIVFDYNRYALGRSYIPPNQDERNRIARDKLYIVREAVRDQSIVLCDDSIVRGTQLVERVRELQETGAKEVHVRIGAPKLTFPCRHGISTRSKDELIGSDRTVEEIRKILGATTLKYNSVESFVQAIGIPADKLCLACWTGEYPS